MFLDSISYQSSIYTSSEELQDVLNLLSLPLNRNAAPATPVDISAALADLTFGTTQLCQSSGTVPGSYRYESLLPCVMPP